MSRDHRKLKAFQYADGLVIMVYRETKKFPREELFGLTSQMRRAAVSVAANIVEGCARSGEREYVHALNMAMGSLREVGYFIDLASRLGYLDNAGAGPLLAQYDDAAKVLSGLLASFRGMSGEERSSRKPQASGLDSPC